MAPDGKHPLDHSTRRWICQACVEAPKTIPQIADEMTARGWVGEARSMWSTVQKLVSDGWLQDVGEIRRGSARPSPLFRLVAGRKDELRAAIRRNAEFRVEPGLELVLVPTGSLIAASRLLASHRQVISWGARTADSQIALLIALDGTLPKGDRDRFVAAITHAGAVRVTVDTNLGYPDMMGYSASVSEQHGAAIESAT